MLIIKELVIAPTHLDRVVNPNATLANQRSIDFAATLIRMPCDKILGLPVRRLGPYRLWPGGDMLQLFVPGLTEVAEFLAFDAFNAGNTLPLLQKRNRGDKPTHDYVYNFHVIHERRRE